MNAQRMSLPLTLTMLLLLLAGALLLGAAARALAPDDPGTLYVSADGDCGGMTPCYDVIQEAVDAAAAGDLVKVAAGLYTGVNSYGGLSQAVFITKSIAIRGGYTAAFAEPPDPTANPTTLDAVDQGRVVYIAGPGIDVTLEGLRLTGGDASGLGGGPYAFFDYGGGIYAIAVPSLVIRDSVVYSNTASTDDVGYGGGLYVIGGSATLSGNTFRGNFASDSDVPSYGSGFGGGAFLADGTFLLIGNTFRNNVASDTTGIYGGGDGGGLFLQNSAAALTGNTIQDNQAAQGYNQGYGGGLYLNGGALTLTGNTIRGNHASDPNIGDRGNGGGGWLVGTAVTVTGNIIEGNVAGATGGCWGGGLAVSDTRAWIEGNVIQGNVANGADWGGGGGLFLPGGLDMAAVNVHNNTIQGNSASGTGQGGGLYLAAPNSPDGLPIAWVSGNVIRDNTAAKGAGVYLSSPSTRTVTEWTNNAIVDNHALSGGQGSGLYVRCYVDVATLTAYLRHTTMAGNSGGDGSGIYVEPSTIFFTNTLIYSHTVGLNNAGGAVSMDHTLWDATATHYTGPVDETNPLSGSPAFAPDGYHLTAGSAAINLGAAAGVSHDIDGQHRPAGPAPDVGADEFAFSVYLPLVLRGSPSP